MAEPVALKSLDHEDNPFSVDEIEPRLYLGNATAARNMKFLKSSLISHILTIDSFPIPAYVAQGASVQIKYIHISDMSKENILEHFDESISFIEEALKDPCATNGVLIHCFYGVSRSATIVIAYLMKKYRISYQKAFERAKDKRILVQPNHGFVIQLKLFHKMGYKIDPSYKNYKIFRLKLAAEQVKSARILPAPFLSLLSPDPGLMTEKPEPNVYRCRKCRRIVASKSNLITHKPKDQEIGYESSLLGQKSHSTHKFLNMATQEEASKSLDFEAIVELTDNVLNTTLSDKSLSAKEKEPENCSRVYFVEPISWMKEIVNNVEGKLYCPSCKSKIGSFNWAMASKCPCGQQVAPSFYLVPSKIEYSNIVQNLQQVTV